MSFSRKWGSRESLKVCTRWGFRLWLRQMLFTVDLLTPMRSAKERQLHGVRPLGLDCKVVSIMAWIFSGL